MLSSTKGTKETPFNGCQHGNWSGHHRLLGRPRQQIIKIRDIAVDAAAARARSMGILQIFLNLPWGRARRACRERLAGGMLQWPRRGRVFFGWLGLAGARQVMNPVDARPWCYSPRHRQGEVGAGAALPLCVYQIRVRGASLAVISNSPQGCPSVVARRLAARPPLSIAR